MISGWLSFYCSGRAAVQAWAPDLAVGMIWTELGQKLCGLILHGMLQVWAKHVVNMKHCVSCWANSSLLLLAPFVEKVPEGIWCKFDVWYSMFTCYSSFSINGNRNFTVNSTVVTLERKKSPFWSHLKNSRCKGIRSPDGQATNPDVQPIQLL